MAISRKHIDKVFGQKFSLLDRKMLDKYFSDEKLNQETKNIIREQWDQFEPDSSDNLPDLDRVFFKLYYTIDGPKDASYRIHNLYFKIIQIAAILIAGAFISLSVYLTQKDGREIIPQQVEFISYSGFRDRFKLPDGTSGWLGYGSRLKYHIDGSNHRIVDLDGLAYFDVAHRQEQPFIVKTPQKLDIRVHGTKFNVSSYSRDGFCEIVLESGKVELSRQNLDFGEMNPDERVVYHSKENTIEKSSVNVADFVAWKDGKLILNDNSLEEACLKLGRFYNVDFELKTKGMAPQKVRLILEDETLEEALKLLTMIVPVRYQVKDREVLENNSYSKRKIIIKNK